MTASLMSPPATILSPGAIKASAVGASPASRARPGNGRPGSSPATRRTVAERGRGWRGRSGRLTWRPSSPPATSPRRRVRGAASEEVTLERGRLDAGAPLYGRMRRSEVSALRWADVDDAANGDGGAGHRPPREDEPGVRDAGRAGS